MMKTPPPKTSKSPLEAPDTNQSWKSRPHARAKTPSESDLPDNGDEDDADDKMLGARELQHAIYDSRGDDGIAARVAYQNLNSLVRHIINTLMPVQLNSFKDLRVLLLLTDRGILAQSK
jgi:hypothetical protein